MQYENSKAVTLSDVYKTNSLAKNHAYAYCVEKCRAKRGYNLRIITHNANMFTVGFTFHDRKTGKIKFMYITKDYDTIIDYES